MSQGVQGEDRDAHGDDTDEPNVDEFLADEIQQGVDDGIERSTRRVAAAEQAQEDADKENATAQAAGSLVFVQMQPTSPTEEAA